MTIREITQESYSAFRKRSIDNSREYLPNISNIDLPAREVLEENGIRFMEVPTELFGDGAVLAQQCVYAEFTHVNWGDWSMILSVSHRKINDGQFYIVRGVLKNDFS